MLRRIKRRRKYGKCCIHFDYIWIENFITLIRKNHNMKKLQLSLCFFLFASFQFVLAQGFQPSVADSLREEGKLVEAIEEYRKIYFSEPENRSNTYNLACAFALNWQRDSAFHYINIATAKDTSVQVLNDPDFIYLIEDERWALLQDKIVERVEVKYGKYPKLELAKELWTLKIKDQAFYYHIEVAEKQGGRNSPLVKALWHTKSLINEKTQARVEEIIDEHGWPTISDVKGNAASTVFLIIQHADLDVQLKYMPMMKEAAAKGEASSSSLALLIDRTNLRQGKKQVYGSQIGRTPEGEMYVQALEDPDNVDKRREEMKLGPLDDYTQRFGFEWDLEAYKKKLPEYEKLLQPRIKP